MEISVSRGVSSNGVPLYTCNTCGLSFPTTDLQRLHMKTEWHRYNLKRRVAQLPPISAEVFSEKILEQQAQQKLEEESARSSKNGKPKSQNRQKTKKDLRLEEKERRRQAAAQVSEHILRQKSKNSSARSPSVDSISAVSSTFSLGDPVHHENTDDESLQDFSDAETKSIATETETEDIDEDSDEELDDVERHIKQKLARNKPIPPTHCFMTDKEFPSVEENAAHLFKEYGMFIPEREYLKDLEGLMTYLGEKIGLGNMCLYCNFEARTLEAVRAHMLAKGHLKIPYETMDQKLEISDFYDFRSSYKKPSSSSSTAEDADTTMKEGDGDDDDWEDEEVEDGEEYDDDEEIPEDYGVVTEHGLELALGNLRAGHRSMARYYKQNLYKPTIPEGQGTLVAADQRLNTNMVKSTDSVEVKKAKKIALRHQRKMQDQERRRELKTINFQTHYRDQLLQ